MWKRSRSAVLICAIFFTVAAFAATKVHVIVLGKLTPVQWQSGIGDNKPITLRVRALMVDGRTKEYVMDSPHEVTERLFVARRAFRANDSLPGEMSAKWQWQRGGWLLVDRMTGRVSPINLPEFDAFYSLVSWYRDYAAYCGVSDDGKKTYAIVTQIGRRKPVLKAAFGAALSEDAGPDSACQSPTWQRAPVRVTFEAGDAKQTFAIRGHVVDVVNDADEDDEGK